MSQRRATISRSDRGVVGVGEAGSLAIRLASRGVRHRPFSIAESLDAARVIARDWRVDSIPRSAVVVGIMLDPSGVRKKLREFLLCYAMNTAAAIKQDGT